MPLPLVLLLNTALAVAGPFTLGPQPRPAPWRLRPGAPETVGESTTTHFWMPGVGGLVVLPGSEGDVILHIDENGDGVPPTNCSAVRCPPTYYVRSALPGTATVEGWSALPAGPMCSNGMLRLSNGTFRGFATIALDRSTNSSGSITYEDWRWTRGRPGAGRRTLLVGTGRGTLGALPKVHGSRLQIMPSGATLGDGTRLLMAYGVLDRSPTVYSSFLFASADDGASWALRTVFNRTAGMPSARGCVIGNYHALGPCGPAEPAMTLLPDGKTLLAVLRMQSNQYLWQSTSSDGGHSWAELAPTAAWSVFPQLRTLHNGATVLTSGRPSIGMWVLNVATMQWSTFLNLAAAHNSGLPSSGPMSAKDYKFNSLQANVNGTNSPISSPAETKAYTALGALPCTAASCPVLVAYDRLANSNTGPPGPNGKYDRVFSMVIHVSAAAETATRLKTDDPLALAAARPAADRGAGGADFQVFQLQTLVRNRASWWH